MSEVSTSAGTSYMACLAAAGHGPAVDVEPHLPGDLLFGSDRSPRCDAARRRRRTVLRAGLLMPLAAVPVREIHDLNDEGGGVGPVVAGSELGELLT